MVLVTNTVLMILGDTKKRFCIWRPIHPWGELKKMVIICPNCKQQLTFPKIESSQLRCSWCGKVFNNPTFKLEPQLPKPQLNLFERKETKAKHTSKEYP